MNNREQNVQTNAQTRRKHNYTPVETLPANDELLYNQHHHTARSTLHRPRRYNGTKKMSKTAWKNSKNDTKLTNHVGQAM